jgi:S-formylglutathione hydrolase FrmB
MASHTSLTGRVTKCALLLRSCALLLAIASAAGSDPPPEALAHAVADWELHRQPIPPDSTQRRHFRIRSELLSAFWDRDMFLEAAVILPPNHDPAERLPVCYFVHGFTNWELWAFRFSDSIIAELNVPSENYPRMIYVFPNAQFGLGHHVFADSETNGPWGESFVTELVPAVEAKYGGAGEESGRFLAGHSSGAWSALWLQITYPETFGGAWAMAPDPVDFRSFTGVNIYTDANAFVDEAGTERMLVRERSNWVQSFRDITQSEAKKGPFAGQFASFDNVFSPRGPDGLPMRLFNWETGAIDRNVAEAWKKYDISLILRSNWEELGPKLAGKLHLYAGSLDNFRLNESVELLKQDLDTLDSDADIIIVEGANHSIFRPQPDYWPEGLVEHMHRAMEAQYTETRAASGL